MDNVVAVFHWIAIPFSIAFIRITFPAYPGSSKYVNRINYDVSCKDCINSKKKLNHLLPCFLFFIIPIRTILVLFIFIVVIIRKKFIYRTTKARWNMTITVGNSFFLIASVDFFPYLFWCYDLYYRNQSEMLQEISANLLD